jgi:hypothetical protein
MTIEEKHAMKAACVQAAATLIAAQDSARVISTWRSASSLPHCPMSALIRPIGGSLRNTLGRTNGTCTAFARATVKAAKGTPLPTNGKRTSEGYDRAFWLIADIPGNALWTLAFTRIAWRYAKTSLRGRI